MTIRHGFSSEYWLDLRPHPVTCTCAADGYHCERAQAVAEEAAERREMAGTFPSQRTRHAYDMGHPKCSATGPVRYASGSDINCPDCRRAIGMAS